MQAVYIVHGDYAGSYSFPSTHFGVVGHPRAGISLSRGLLDSPELAVNLVEGIGRSLDASSTTPRDAKPKRSASWEHMGAFNSWSDCIRW